MKLKVADICIVHAVTIDGNGLWALIEEVSDLECVQKKEVIEDDLVTTSCAYRIKPGCVLKHPVGRYYRVGEQVGAKWVRPLEEAIKRDPNEARKALDNFSSLHPVMADNWAKGCDKITSNGARTVAAKKVCTPKIVRLRDEVARAYKRRRSTPGVVQESSRNGVTVCVSEWLEVGTGILAWKVVTEHDRRCDPSVSAEAFLDKRARCCGHNSSMRVPLVEGSLPRYLNLPDWTQPPVAQGIKRQLGDEGARTGKGPRTKITTKEMIEEKRLQRLQDARVERGNDRRWDEALRRHKAAMKESKALSRAPEEKSSSHREVKDSEPSAPPCEGGGPFHSLADIRIAAKNVRSAGFASAGTLGSKFNQSCENLGSLVNQGFHIIALSETWHRADNAELFRAPAWFHDGWDYVASEGDESVGKHGACILFNRRSLERSFILETSVVVKGKMVAINLTHRSRSWGVTIVSVYLKSGSSSCSKIQQRRVEEIERIRAHISDEWNGWDQKMAKFGILIGDFNFEGFGMLHGKALESMVDEFGGFEVQLVEQGKAVDNDANEGEREWTRAAFDSVNNTLQASAIDRAFVLGQNVSALAATAVPMLLLAHEKYLGISDHRPIGLTWVKVQHTRRLRSTPNFLPEHPAFLPAVHKEFSRREKELLRSTPRASGQARWRVFSASVRAVSNKLSAVRGCTMSLNNKLIGAAAATISALHKSDFKGAERSGGNHEVLADILSKNGSSDTGIAASLQEVLSVLNKAIDGKCNLLSADLQRAQEEGEKMGMGTTRNRERPLFLDPKHIKRRFFSTKVVMSEVIDADGVKHSTPSAVACAIGKEYENCIWAPSPSSARKIRGGALAAKLRRAVPNIGERVKREKLVKPSLQQVRNKILGSRSSSNGPDGLSIPVIKVAIDITAPILLRIIEDLFDEGFDFSRFADDFNVSTLICIPKKGNSNHIKDLRPISIANFANRIVSGVVKDCLEEALVDAISFSQSAFLPGRLMTNTITEVLHNFYASVLTKSDLHLLQVDFKKAYDNVNREFLFFVLEVWGLPPEWDRVLRRLHSNVRAQLWCDNSVEINVMRSIKQGDPLSCILILPVIQTLIDLVGDKCVWHREFADDVTAAFHDLSELQKFTEAIDEFVVLSDFPVNHQKTTLTSSVELSVKDKLLLASLPGEWPKLKAGDEGNILGVKFGRNIAENDIWNDAIMKLSNRAFEAESKTVMCGLKRIAYVNTFVSSIITHQSQFYGVTDPIKKATNNIFSHMILPKFNAISGKMLYVPPAYGGFGMAIRDPVHTSIAGIVRNLLPSYCRMFPLPPERYIWHPLDPFMQLEYALNELPRDLRSELENKCRADRSFTPDQSSIYKALDEADEEKTVWPKEYTAAKASHWVGAKNRWEVGERVRARWNVSRKIRGCAYALHFNMLLFYNAVPFRHRMRYIGGVREVERDDKCPMCEKCVESSRHVLSECEITRQAVRIILFRLGILYQAPNGIDFLEMIMASLEPLPIPYEIIMELCVAIWWTRNAIVHRGVKKEYGIGNIVAVFFRKPRKQIHEMKWEAKAATGSGVEVGKMPVLYPMDKEKRLLDVDKGRSTWIAIFGHDKEYPGHSATGGEAESIIEQELESLYNAVSPFELRDDGDDKAVSDEAGGVKRKWDGMYSDDGCNNLCGGDSVSNGASTTVDGRERIKEDDRGKGRVVERAISHFERLNNALWRLREDGSIDNISPASCDDKYKTPLRSTALQHLHDALCRINATESTAREYLTKELSSTKPIIDSQIYAAENPLYDPHFPSPCMIQLRNNKPQRVQQPKQDDDNGGMPSLHGRLHYNRYGDSENNKENWIENRNRDIECIEDNYESASSVVRSKSPRSSMHSSDIPHARVPPIYEAPLIKCR